MKRNIKNFLIKAFSMCLAFILVFPTNLFAMGLDNTKTRKYKASASIMGLAQTDTTSQNDTEVTDQTLLETEITKKETDKYLIEKYARLSKTTGQIEYMIKVHPKDKESKDMVTTSFAISKNTDLKDLKIEKISQIHSDKTQTEIKYQEQRPSILYNNDAFETLGVTTDKADLVYYLSAKLSDESLAKIDDKTPTMDLDINIAETGANTYQDRYALSIEKMDLVDEDGEYTIETLKEKEDAIHQISAIYKEGNSNLLGENPGEIVWTDFIHADDDKEFTTDIKLDEAQDATDSQIRVEFYQANEKGYTLKEDFTKEIPFTESLKLQIPLGFIAKVELKTKASGNAKEYSLNHTKIPNPIYKEEKTEEKSEEDDADPLPKESPDTEEPKDTSEEKIIPIDPETNEAVIDHSLVKEDTKEESEPTKEETSAINLNRDSVINNFKNKDKLNPVVEITINNISSLFNAYNNDEMTYEDFLASLKTQASDLSKEDFAEIIKGLIAGLNQETYKVAKIDEDQLLAEIYGKDEAEEQATEEKPVTEAKEADTEETSNVETDTNNVETETKEDFRTPEDKIKDNALESFDESLNQAKEASKKPQEDDRSLIGNISEGIKGIFGQSNLQKADQELKAALEAGKSLEEIQALLDSFEEKYQLSREEQVRLMEDNNDAIKALIAKDSETNFRPHIFVASELNLDGKKFHVLTRFDTSTAHGDIQAGQLFKIHLDEKLTVKEGTTLDPIKYNGEVIANPEYNPTDNTIVYTIANDITENIQVPLDIPVDYKTNKIELDENGEFVVVNKVSGLGVTDPKSLLPQRVDRNGNLAATIIEPDKKEVAQLIEVDLDPYRVYTDANATPVIKDGKLLGFNWTIKVTSDTDLSELGYKANFTTVKGSGLGEIEDRNKSLDLTDQLDGAFGINDSKHHKVDKAGIREVTYNLYTPVEETPQEKYMMDISIILTEKRKVGAKRIVVNEGWPIEKVREETPNRVGMNNRTTILGEFANESTAKWTVTDAVSTGDGTPNLPIENRQLQGDQTGSMGQTAAYKIDPLSGMMVKDDTGVNGSKPVGTIAVYEYTGTIGKDQKGPQTLGGVSISRYQDVTVDQNWNLPDGQKMPSQTITVTDKDGNKSETKVDGGPVVSGQTGKQRIITVPDVKYWDIDDNGTASFRDHTVSQSFPEGKVTIQTPEGEKEYKYSENANYFRPDTRVHYIQNSLEEDTDKTPATFTVVKVDSKDPEKRVPGASFDLLGANVSITTDANGEATFRNIKPGRYYLTEKKAPDGYKIDQNQKTIEISDTGQITVYGGNAKLSDGSGKTAIVEHSDYPNWPDYMNTMHYGKLDENGNLEFYVYLKPFAPRLGGRTDKDTRFNISIPGVNLTNTEVKVYDLDPQYREYYTGHMEKQTMDQAIVYNDVTNVDNNGGKITGTQITTDPYTEKSGYSIFFPQARFGEDWGFLVKVKANVGTTNPVTLSYDWLANENTATNSKIQEVVNISTNPDENGHPTITINNEPFDKSSIEVAKFADRLDAEGNRIKLTGAQFVLKDANGKPITNDYTDTDGKVNFGEFPPGTYYLEEQTAPAGYEKSDVYFEVKVNEKGEVTYTAKFKTSPGTPVPGQDYFIDKGEATSTDAKATVLDLYQHMDIKDSGRGRFQGVWEAYELESLKYELKAKLNIAGPGSRFEVQFDKNLDFTQYFTEFPDLYDDGKVIAKPYFDRNTNLLTYVFTENAKKGETTISFNLVGMIPNKFYAKTHGVYPITNVVQPGTNISENIGNQTEKIDVHAYFGEYDARRNSSHKPLSSPPSQAYYFRDVYQDENGQWYVKAFAYYNPYGLYSGGAKNIRFNWMSTNYQQNKIQHEWNANGNLPAFQLDNVKVYKTDKKLTDATYNNGNKDVTEEVSAVMPLSMGIRPEQDPSTYRKVFETNIDPGSFKSASSNDVYLEYDPKEIKSDSNLQYDAPLKMTMPKISGEKEGYVIEQTFKIPDIKKFNENWRAFYMGQNTVLRSTFVTGPNKNYGNADQTGQEIPKFYKEIVGIINRKFTPGKFMITKTEDNTGKALQGAVFALTDASGNTIYRSSDTNGLVEFKDLKPGRYTLVESQAPEGHTGSKEKWEVIVSNDGSVRIEEISVTGSGTILTGNNSNIINIPVTNRKTGENFQVFKKGEDGKPLPGATFTITKEDETNPIATATSDDKGIVNFTENLSEGTYIIEETKAPDGYNKLDQKWVLVVSKDDKGKLVKKVYNYSQRTDNDEKSLLGGEGTRWVNVKDRPQIGWESFDNRNTGWAGNSTEAEHLGTRIIAINKKDKYVIQRYVINPEAIQTKGVDGVTSATIHREKPNYPNMDWYNGEDYKVFTLAPKEGADTDGKVTGLISDLRLADYTVTDITEDVKKTAQSDSTSHYNETRLKLQIPETNKPILIDVKIPYKDENGGVGTGMDRRENGITYWKSDYYERVSEILLGDTVASEVGSIKGSYIGENSLDVTNEPKTYGFKIKKVKEGATTTLIPGAKFKLIGPDPSTEEREMTTGSDGMISFNGLKPGKYELEETEPAPGYEKTDKKWQVTITNEDKAYIKADEETSSTNRLAARRLQSAKANDGLEISDERVPATQMADDGWMEVDPDRSSGRGNIAHSNNMIQTRITKINKGSGSGRFKQVFLFADGSPGKERLIEIHRQPEGKNALNLTGTTVNVYTTNASDIDSALNSKTATSIKATQKSATSEKPARLKISVPGNKKGYILVEVETSYSGALGLGTDYYPSRTDLYTSYWVGDSYENESGVMGKVQNYTVSFAANGGNGTMDSQQVEEGQTFTLPENKFTPPSGKEFKAWSVNGEEKAPQDTITVNADIEVTAIWKDAQVTISFDGNGGTYQKAPEKVDKGSSYMLPGNPFIAPEGKEFAGWIVGSSIKQPGESIIVDNDITIKAQWKNKAPETYTITVSKLENGTLIPSTNSATAGTEVKLTVTPDDGYEIDSVTINGKALSADASGNYKFTMPAANVTLSATFKKKQEEIKPPAGAILIKDEGYPITNKQTGLEFTVFKVNNLNRRLPDAEFTIVKYKDNTYKELDGKFTKATGTSDENGLVQFKDENGNVVSLPKGHYIITETKAPEGYKKAQAPWKLEVYEEAGQLKAKYSGPEDTANGLLTSDKAKAQSNNSTELQKTNNGIKYKSRLTYINPESKTYVQRVYIDTRNYTGNGKLNVQITPKYKRDEIDYVPDKNGAKSPDTIVEGVKTAYRTTYKITGGVEDTEIDNVLRYYDLSKPNVTMKNTARWRPFDWGFDEDLLNLDKGVYFIDIEGFYDDAIITGYDSKQKKNTIPEADQGKLDLNIDFYDGERKFQQRIKDKSGNLTWTKGTDINDAYLLGNVHLGYVGKNAQGQDVPTEAGLKRENPNDKYPLWLGKKGGRIYPSLDQGTKTSISTRVDISSLYSSDSMKVVPQDGLTLTNEEETYNITFSKHGRDNPDYKIDGEEVTKKRLEGAIFKLQEDNGITFEDVPGSYVASAFNGYFGFRGLKPGRYRLLEVKAPEGYVPIKDPLLYFTVETIATNSGKIIHPLTGKEVDIKSIQVKFPGNKTVYELKNLTMVDPADKTKTVAISTVDSDKIDIEKAEIIDPNDNTKKVPLKDLSIPGDKQDYKIGHTRVVEGKSGYISLEYDKANGVYQYVPEKSTTTEEGKLIDYVTSATAKNMGKIINEKPGKGEVTVKKYDQNNNPLKGTGSLPGAQFRLTNLTNGETKTGTIGENGTLDFKNLQIGNYRLIETKSPDGYENTNQIWHFSIGGEGLDPYSGPIARTGVDLSDKITLQTIKASVLNPDAKTSTEITTQNNEVHPHLGESIEFENKFELAPNTKINPGDFFTLKMSEDIDLNGIFEYEIENLDIIAPGVGTIAKADYNRNARTITYTFTDYAKTYTLVKFSNKLTAFIDLYKVKSNANKNVGFRISENDKSQYKNVNVVYDQDYGRQADHFGNTINITSKIVKYDPKTGEFLHYYYVNKLKDFSYGPIEFRYESGQRIDDLKIDVAKVYNNNWQLSSTMPDSFAVNESSNNLYPFENAVRYQWLNRGYYAPVHFNDGIGRGDSYIVKVTGRVGDKDKSEYTGFGTLYKFNQGYTPTHAERHDSIRYFKNESTAETKLEIQAVNPENKITFKKVDQNGKALAGAKFRLDYLAPNSSTWSQGSERDTDKDGVLKLTKLKPGKYKLTETSAPEGYKMATNPIMEFEVDKNGKITKEVTSVDGKSTTTQDISGSTNYIVNSKTYEIEFKKVDEDDNTKALEGAEFEIWYKALESDEYSKDKLKLYQDASGNKLVLKADETAPKGYTEVKKYTTGKDGIVKFSFTEQGYYAIREIKAPKGYIAPREYVEEFVVMDGKVQTDRYKTEMDVSKTKGWFYANGMHDVYNTDITMRFNPDHEKITYTKDNSKITLSGLPLNNEYYENNISQKTGITIEARLVNDRGKSDPKSYALDLTKNYTNDKGNITIDLYDLVKELENKTGDSITSDNTIELSMSSTLALNTELDIKSNIVIGDINEERTFHIGTKGDEKVDHSYTFTKLGEPKLPIPIENKKSTFPLTGGNGVFIGFAIIGTAVMLTALAYFGIYQNDKNRRRSARYKK